MASPERVVCHCLMLLTKVRSKAIRKPTRRSLEEATQLLRCQYERTRTATALVVDALPNQNHGSAAVARGPFSPRVLDAALRPWQRDWIFSVHRSALVCEVSPRPPDLARHDSIVSLESRVGRQLYHLSVSGLVDLSKAVPDSSR